MARTETTNTHSNAPSSRSTVNPSAHAGSGSAVCMKHPSGHTITVWGDGAVYDETSNGLINVDTLVRG